jgi:hypothetical protein
MGAKISREHRFQPVEIGKVDGVRTVIEAVPEVMSAFGGLPMVAATDWKVGLVAQLKL